MALTKLKNVVLVAGLALAACAPADAGTGIPPGLEAEVEGLDGVKAQVMADSLVTMEELEVVANLVYECLVDRGVEVVEFRFDNGDIGATMSGDAAKEGADATAEAEGAFDACFESEFRLFADIYNYQNRLTDAERNAYHDAWVECMNSQGVAIAEADEIDGNDPGQTDAVFYCSDFLEQQGW